MAALNVGVARAHMQVAQELHDAWQDHETLRGLGCVCLKVLDHCQLHVLQPGHRLPAHRQSKQALLWHDWKNIITPDSGL